MAKGFDHFNMWLKVEIEDDESMTTAEWGKWIEEQKKALGKHFAKALHVRKATVTVGHIERAQDA